MCDHATDGFVTASHSDRAAAAGLQLTEKYPDLMPGVLFFGCQRHQATINLDTCQRNWREAYSPLLDKDGEDRRKRCRGCRVGQALHGGIEQSSNDAAPRWVDLRVRTECVRCGRTEVRLIPSTGECASCWNRRRESLRGRNARGKPMLHPVTMTPRRVGLVVDGKPTYRQFLAWHDGEALSRAIKAVDGARFHAEQPAKSVWNKRLGRFEYRCSTHPGELGCLREQVSADGTTRYVCQVCQPSRARGLPEARVEAATSLADPEFVKQALIATIDARQLTEFWTPTAHVCGKCRYYAVETRQRTGRIETRCPFCDAK